ncbi:hypothetical protein NDA01_28045 [Trichocoleus desertorum AS-A10]|uniref:hypothetical protein n=1 Tax=Trichocoleus desertorum TaxID=1481672 RepID=UPI00329969BE
MGIKLNLGKLNEAIAESFEATVDAYAEQCQVEITSDKWDWPRTTHRQNGEIVNSPRSIVDTGELRDSQQEPEYLDDNTAVIEWTAPHALEVHNGIVENGILKPSRPWTETALQEIDLTQVMSEELRDRL